MDIQTPAAARHGIDMDKRGISMGLAYFFIALMISGAGALVVILLRTAWKIWNSPKWRALAALPLLLAVPCGITAVYLVALVWKEPPWGFRF